MGESMTSPLRLLPRQGQGSVTAWLPKASSIGPLRHLLPTTGSLSLQGESPWLEGAKVVTAIVSAGCPWEGCRCVYRRVRPLKSVPVSHKM